MSSSLTLSVVWQLLLLLISCVTIKAQYKTAGIKTRQYMENSANLVAVNQSSSSSYNGTQYNGHYVPAEVYQGHTQDRYIAVSVPVPLDATAEFINKTRATIADGICYKEVPTASLPYIGRTVPIGNGTTPDMSRVQVCCEGYERNPHIYHRCEPICADDCPNGICTAPNTCVCIPGHIRNQENKCISTCPLGCSNGVCDEHNQCSCRPGYQLEPVNGKYCVPDCQPPCANGQCVAPNKCACLDGYRPTAASNCVPSCDNCENGQCVAPGICNCKAGYMKVNHICEPICSLGCQNGRCIAPDTCACATGFEIDRTGSRCVPHCDLPCLNGICDGHNTCMCNPGYVLDENQRNICRPHCPQGCPNGYCTSPNFCVCKPGFIKSGIKGHRTCIQAQ